MEFILISHTEWAIYHFVRAAVTPNETAAAEEMKNSWLELFMAALMEEEVVIG
jgi:hypothetical protein